MIFVGAMDYMLKRWALFTRFLEDGRICLTNNAAERVLRGLALGRKAPQARSSPSLALRGCSARKLGGGVSNRSDAH